MNIEVTDQMLDAARDIIIDYDEPGCDSCLTKIYEAMEAVRRRACGERQGVFATSSAGRPDCPARVEASI